MANLEPGATPDYEYEWQDPNRRGFEIGRVMSRAFNTLKENWKPFLLWGAILTGIPTALQQVSNLSMQSAAITGDTGAFGAGVIGIFIVSLIFSLIGYFVFQAAVTQAAFKSFAGQPVNFNLSLRSSLKLILPLLGLAILVGLGVMLGLILLIIPGLILALGWSVATPVYVVERPGITEALSRSWELSKGFKRYMLIIWILIYVIGAIFSGIFLAIVMGGSMLEFMMGGGTYSTGQLTAIAIFYLVYQAVISSFMAVLFTSAYFEMRDIKDGVPVEGIAAIFD